MGAKFAHEHGVKVLLDVGGDERPLENDLLQYVNIISPNETELWWIIKST